MYVCVYIYIYMYICVCVCIYIYIYIYTIPPSTVRVSSILRFGLIHRDSRALKTQPCALPPPHVNFYGRFSQKDLGF